MLKYEFEELQSDVVGFGALKGMKTEFSGFETIIGNRAKDGWRYAGYLPKKQSASGNLEQIVLVFEKEQ